MPPELTSVGWGCLLGTREDKCHLWSTVVVSLGMTHTSALFEQETIELLESMPNTHHAVISIPGTPFLKGWQGEKFEKEIVCYCQGVW